MELRALPEGIPPCIITLSLSLSLPPWLFGHDSAGVFSASILLNCSLSEGFGELDLKKLYLGGCKALAMDTEINKIVEMKNLEILTQVFRSPTVCN